MGRARRWRRAASNVMFGIALGLLSYYSITTLMGALAQSDLRKSTGDVPVFVSPSPDTLAQPEPQPDTPVLDFSAWDTEDRPYWEGLAEGAAFGRIVIPKIGLDTLVITGVRPADLRRGPGWIDYTNLPGATGNVGISGHRTTYGAPFRRLDELAEGDTIDLFSPYRRYRYRVTRTFAVDPWQTEVVGPTETPTLTLTACHPPYSARKRLIVQAELIEVTRLTDTGQ